MLIKLSVTTKMVFFVLVAVVPLTFAQSEDSGQTMRPVIRGRHAAVASMKAEATEAARRILDAGGNAFDAAVGGQAALQSPTSPQWHSSDAVLPIYNAKDKKVIPSTRSLAPPNSLSSSGTRIRRVIPQSDGLSRAVFPASSTPVYAPRPLGHDEL
jgi:hypothetical protein